MQSASRYIIAAGLGSFGLSLLYFLSLAANVPMWVTVPAIVVCVLFVFRHTLGGRMPGDNTVQRPGWAWLALLAGIWMMVSGFYPLAEQYGGWDGWGIWNLHAKYLADAANWKMMFRNSSFAHPDYPLYIPAVNGFFIRLCSGRHAMEIPFIFHFSITLLIPVLIFLENAKKNTVVAAAIFFLFAIDTFFLTKGATQYADTALAFFFLSAFVCINYAKAGGRRFVTLAAACLAGCVWTKNEGGILAMVFLVFYAGTFLSRVNIKAFLAGFVAPLFIVLLFKVCYAPGSGIFGAQGHASFSQLFVKDRYDLVWNFFKANVAAKFYYVKVCLFIYLLQCMLQAKGPGRQFWLLLCCALAYTMIYVLTPGGIEWLLDTSQERLMHQLMPALMYVFSQRFTDINMSLPVRLKKTV